MKTEQKEYPQQPFSVEPTKLSKLLNTIHGNLDGGAAIQDRFMVHMKGDRKAEFSDIDEVLGLDNSRKKRIERLIIRSFRGHESTAGPGREIEVDFGATRKKDGFVHRGVTIQVSGDTSTWVSDALSDVEQQVERTWTRSGPPVVIAASIIIVSLISILLAILPARIPAPTSDLASTMWLTPAQIDSYASNLKQGSVSAEDAKTITSQQLTNLSTALEQQKAEPRHSMASVLLTTLVPLAVVVAISFFIIAVCYPSVVFLWGDEKDRQIWRDSAKRYLWPLLLAITFVPIVTRLLLSGALQGLVK